MNTNIFPIAVVIFLTVQTFYGRIKEFEVQGGFINIKHSYH